MYSRVHFVNEPNVLSVDLPKEKNTAPMPRIWGQDEIQ